MPTPTWQAAGSGSIGGTGSVQPDWPTSLQVGDLGILVVQSANEPVVLSDPQGFVELVAVGIGTAGLAGATRVTVFTKVATSTTEPAPTVADAGDHVRARIFKVRGQILTEAPFGVILTESSATVSPNVVIPGGTTLAAESLLLLIAGHAIDQTGSQASDWTNPDLGSLIERFEANSSAGVGGGFAVATATKEAIGAFGPTTATLLQASAQVRLVIEIRSQAVPAAPPSVVTVAPTGLRLNLAIPEGLSGFDGTQDLADDGQRVTFRLGAPFVSIANDPAGAAVDTSFTAFSVIEAARDRHSSFDSQRHPNPILLRFLDRYQRHLVGEVVQRNISLLAATYTITLPLTNFAAGIVLPITYHLLHGGEVVLIDGARAEFHLIPWGRRASAGQWYSGWDHGGRLYLSGESNDWGGVTAIDLSYVPTVPRIASLRAVLSLPRSSEAAMVEATAAFMAGRAHSDPQLPAIDEGAYIGRAASAEEAWLRQIGRRRQTQVKQVKEVW